MEKTRNITLSTTWLKAAVLGSIWASSEIVLGSFFHNLRIPFSSIILTGIALILIVSVSHRWRDKGLVWRAGLVCAVMKSVSPSAIIFGPMIAIILESLLIEMSLLLLGRNFLGFLIGGMLAMSWNLAQKIINMLIYYGFNIVELYNSLVMYAGRQLNIPDLDTWTPVIILWSVYLVFGAMAAIVGIAIGRASQGNVSKYYTAKGPGREKERHQRADKVFSYSFLWLGFTIAGMLLVLFLMNTASISWWAGSGLVLLVIWVSRYHGILRRLQKLKFWITFVLITLLSSMVIVKVQSSDLTWVDGFMAGLEMNFRAAVMMVGFSIIGKEMSNPVIRNLFMNSSFRQLPLALEVAFDTLPFALSNMPPLSELSRHPLRALRQFGAHAETWLERIEKKERGAGRVVIVTGPTGAGKTTMLSALASLFLEEGIRVSGILAPAVMEDGVKTGYNIMDVSTRKWMTLSQTVAQHDMGKVGRFYFHDDAIQFGREILNSEKTRSASLVVIDEIGPWELEGEGWSACFTNLLLHGNSIFILAVRSTLVDRVIDYWRMKNPMTIDVGRLSVAEAFALIREIIPAEGQ